MPKRVGILGCGAILPRHIEAISLNEEFELAAICDIQDSIAKELGKKFKVPYYKDYKDMVASESLDLITIATPNSLHYEQAIFCLENGCDVLIEKPAAFTKEKVEDIIDRAKKMNRNAYCVLQVRLNPTVQLIKEVLKTGILGKIRSVSLIQRWQRPIEYFTGWRAIPSVGGGTLHEVGIHYLDIVQYLFGQPKVHSSKSYQTKHKGIDIEDTVYSIIDFGSFGGTCEITIAAEPRNLECSMSILGANGYVKIGGKAMNVIESANFLSHGSQTQFENLSSKYNISYEPNSYGSYQGSCPNHPFVYENLSSFRLEETLNVIAMIEEIYKKSEISYEDR